MATGEVVCIHWNFRLVAKSFVIQLVITRRELNAKRDGYLDAKKKKSEFVRNIVKNIIVKFISNSFMLRF